MAYFRTTTAFNLGLVDFHGPLLDPAVSVVIALQADVTAHLATQYVITGPIAVRVAGFDTPYSSMLTLTKADGSSENVFGSQLTFDADNQITGGIVGGLGFVLGLPKAWGMVGVAVGGAVFGQAMTSVDAADDRALFATMLAGNDRIVLSGYGDSIDAGGGRDLVLGNGGNDTVNGGGGNDLIDGGKGNDLLYGGLRDDVLFGSDDRDTILGGSGNDIIGGGAGVDRLTGGIGADVFVFGATFAAEASTVTDFHRGTDKIMVEIGVTGLSDLTIIQRDTGAEVSYTNTANNIAHKMLLQGVVAANLTEADFLLGDQATFGTAFSDFYTNWHYFG